MRRQKRTPALALVLLGAAAAAPAVYAGESHGSHGSMMGRGMMGGSGMMGGRGIGMMNQMSRMMDQCGAMMQGNERPNDQWRRSPPSGQDKKD
jgi:hypothetical protein